METRCYRKILHNSYKDHVTSEEVRVKIQQAIGPHEDLLTMVKRCKLQWYGDGHVSCSSGLSKMIMQGTVKGGRRQGRQRKRWEDNIREWTGLEFSKSQRAVENKKKWKKLVVKSSVVSQRPSRLRDWWWWWWCTIVSLLYPCHTHVSHVCTHCGIFLCEQRSSHDCEEEEDLILFCFFPLGVATILIMIMCYCYLASLRYQSVLLICLLSLCLSSSFKTAL